MNKKLQKLFARLTKNATHLRWAAAQYSKRGMEQQMHLCEGIAAAFEDMQEPLAAVVHDAELWEEAIRVVHVNHSPQMAQLFRRSVEVSLTARKLREAAAKKAAKKADASDAPPATARQRAEYDVAGKAVEEWLNAMKKGGAG